MPECEDLKRNMPSIYDGFEEIEALLSTENVTFCNLAEQVTQTMLNQFAKTANEEGIAKYEAILGISPDAGETLEERRNVVLATLALVPPYTMRLLKQMLNTLIGIDQWTVTLDANNYQVYIDMAVTSEAQVLALNRIIVKIAPAHIVFTLRDTPQRGRLYTNEAIYTTTPRWNYVLGAWQLGQLPFVSNLNVEEVKSPMAMSVTDDHLHYLAMSTATRVAKIRLNGLVVITDFEVKTANANITDIEYRVSPGDISNVNLIEMLDSNDTVISTSVVDIPIASSTILKHILPIEQEAS